MKISLSLLSAVALLCAATVAVPQAPRPGKTVPKVGDEHKAKQPPTLPGKKSPAPPAVGPQHYEVKPSETDPKINKPDFPHEVYVNTGATRDLLLIYIPGTGGRASNTKEFLETAVENGYYGAVGVDYDSSHSANQVCGDDADCYGKLREEMLDGRGESNKVSFGPDNCIINRALKLLVWLKANHPDERWGRFLNNGQIDWSKVTVAGLSQGGGHAAMIGKMFSVHRVVMFSSVDDAIREGAGKNAKWKSATWIGQPHKTPVERYYGFAETNDETFYPHVKVNWQTLGLPGELTNVDKASPPYNNSHRLISSREATRAGANSKGGEVAHAQVVRDLYTPLDPNTQKPLYEPVWRYLLGVDANGSASSGDTGRSEPSEGHAGSQGRSGSQTGSESRGRGESRGGSTKAVGSGEKNRDLGDRLDKMVADQVENLKVPGYAVTVIYRGDTILQKGYGFADISSKRRPDAQTVFGLASLTKSFTGLAVLMLVDQGKLKLDDQLDKYIDGLAPAYQKLTIKELATMTAGLPRTLKPDDLTWGQQMKKLRSEPLLSKPGSTYTYSNISYRYLGTVIEKASGETYMEFLRKHVLNPLDMTQTGPTDEHFSRPIATPYEEANGKPKPIEYKSPQVNFAAGMLASDCADLENYTRALLANDRRLLTPEGYELLWKKRWPLKNGDANNWAFGWQSKQKQGHWLVTWNGGDPGIASLIEIYPDDQLIVIGLSNEKGQAYTIGHKISNEVLGIKGGDAEEEPSGN